MMEIAKIPNKRARRILERVLRQPTRPPFAFAWAAVVWPSARRVVEGDVSAAALHELEQVFERWNVPE